MNKNIINIVEKCARIGVFGTYLGHGIVALGINPKWIPLLTCFGFSEEQAIFLMPYIGVLDIIVAFFVLIFPIRIVVLWAVLWAFATALSRPISGQEFVEFVERSANWCLPLVLLLTLGIPDKVKNWLKVRA
ncbi:hypothetical protein NAT51_12755 [Flavobacterium amniphilum]|uniref:hypothetical protein n=1 Tax=Flavobacterium amniphilum TaxID=1834035 RepID=UPI00202A9D93|nr:hypothetical protein [Flavobacterium amniphilum]MCL9805812.1 hypothetical protein [Flavobacterium amniphilum]MCL9806399.1 hypothetical protein [Flavobacterium amniphilum]